MKLLFVIFVFALGFAAGYYYNKVKGAAKKNNGEKIQLND